HELDWADVARGEEKSLVAAYRDYSLTDLELARNTIRQRLLYICEFYEYALKQGWVERLPFSTEDRTVQKGSGGFLGHIDGRGNTRQVRDVMPRKHKILPKFLTTTEVHSLLSTTRNHHHLMIIRMALHTGLRV